jgi:hypothetical protein
LIPFTILFHETLHSYNNLFLSKWKCFQRSQTPTYILTKRKLNKKCPKVYTLHGSPFDFTCIIKCKDFSHDFHKLSCESQCTLMCQKLFTWFSHKLSSENQCTLTCQRLFTWLSQIIMWKSMHFNVLKTFHMTFT